MDQNKEIHFRITDNVLKIMSELKWTKYKLSKELKEIPQSSLYRILDKKLDWTIEGLIEVSEVLGVSIIRLLQYDEKSAQMKFYERLHELEEENQLLREENKRYEAIKNIINKEK